MPELEGEFTLEHSKTTYFYWDNSQREGPSAVVADYYSESLIPIPREDIPALVEWLQKWYDKTKERP